MNKLYFGDNLDVMRERIRPDSVDLVYLDPPFNSNANYNVLFKESSGAASEAQAEAFRDTWEWGDVAASAYEDVMRSSGDVALALKGLRSWIGQNAMMAYIAMMAARLLELRDVLKSTGALYLHCDPKASHYLKIILDSVFGHENFRSEIIWRRSSSHNSITRQFGPIHDSILFYTKSDLHRLRPVFTPHSRVATQKKFRFEDERGLFRLNEIMGPGRRSGESGLPWRGYDPSAKGRHWAMPESLKSLMPVEISNATVQDQLDYLHSIGEIVVSSSGRPEYKQRMTPGVPLQDVWSFQPGTENCLFGTNSSIDEDVRWLGSDRERIGYPTQKPLGLLDRIISSSSDVGDIILDPFCGCGTTVESAERLGRKWIGIDVTHYAITLIEARLKANHPTASFAVHGRPVDIASARDLARRDKHQFQWWAAWRLGSQTYREEKKGADRGIDGNILFKNGPYGDGRIIVSVKGGEHVGAQMVRDLRGVIEREDAEMGVLLCLAEPTTAMMREAADAGFVQRSAHGRLPHLQVATIADILDGKMPKLPPLPQPERKLTPAPKKKDKDQLELLLPFDGEKIVPAKGVVVDPRFIGLTG